MPARKSPSPAPRGSGHKQVGAVVNAIHILRHLAEQPGPVGVVALARTLKLNPSTCFNTLRTLAEFDLVAFDPATKTYRLGIGTAALAPRGAESGRALAALNAAITPVARRNGITISIWRRRQDRLTLVSFAEPNSAWLLRMNVGTRIPLLAGSAGRVVAAHADLPAARLRALFADVRWQQPLSFARYQRDLRAARTDGYAVDDGYLFRETLTLSVPMVDVRGTIATTCTATILRQTRDRHDLPALAAEMTAAVKPLGPLPDF